MLTSLQASHDAYLPTASEPGWLVDLRADALKRFESLGFPNKKVEAWKYSSTARLARTPFVHDAGALFEALAGGVVGAHALRGAAAELVFVNGYFSAGLSRMADLPEGVEIAPLSAAMNERDLSERLDPAGWPALPNAAKPPPRPGELRDDRAFDALNTAFLQDGLVVRVRAGVEVSAPIHVLLVTVGESAPIATHPRLLIDVEPNGSMTLVERHVGSGPETVMVNAITDVVVHDGGRLTHHLWRLEGEHTHHVGHVKVEVRRDATYHSHTAWLGGLWSRNDLDVRFAGPGAEALCTGVVVANGKQHVDNHTWLRHDVERCTSREVYKGVYGGRSRGVFNGMVYIARDAQHTDAELTSKNLLLSDGAQVNAKPELEIYADDVKAAHGCTVGQLDSAALDYLRTRGISLRNARRMLTEGFVFDLLEEVEDADMRAATAQVVEDRLGVVYGELG